MKKFLTTFLLAFLFTTVLSLDETKANSVESDNLNDVFQPYANSEEEDISFNNTKLLNETNTNSIIYDGAKDVSIDFTSPIDLEKGDNLITPLSSFSGNGGSSGLDWGASGNIITWRIKPKTLEPWAFAGKLYVYSGSTLWKSYNLTGAGVLGSTASDTIELGYMVKGSYTFKLTGKAVAPLGNIDFYTVSDDAEITIYKSVSN